MYAAFLLSGTPMRDLQGDALSHKTGTWQLRLYNGITHLVLCA